MAAEENRGLHYVESLLWEKERGDAPGVDLPEPQGTTLRTGFPARGNIGLPQTGEPQVLRHFVRMSTWNYSIDHGMFPLGSCTMKHNPRLNEKMAGLSGFAHLHPMQPEETAQGALALMYDLQEILAELTGLPAVCLTPAAGAHGELAGLMTIRKAHEFQGEARRRVVLIPDSAHGTNPATAAACGYEVKTIPTKETGRLTVAAFKEALGDGRHVAALMATVPNTYGLFETHIKEIAALLHHAGGYFYCDGANFNALAGKARPAGFGADVMHINLHKTFSTPHGGGGPGAGPICTTERLAPFLPVPVVAREERDGAPYYRLSDKEGRPHTLGRLKGFHGQFGMHVRAMAYILSHGADGLKQVSEDAVLNANYLLARLREDYFAPYEGTCMHECLLTDKRQREDGVQTVDIAKALIERGFHPMTVYFPATHHGTMLIEPTETEDKPSLDRFVAAMKGIADDVRQGKVDVMHALPVSAPRRRVDDVKAAREPVLRFRVHPNKQPS
jgi:glycine dehydrogenase subunit 2